jgi:DNA-binding response OmpR family regulator
MAEVGRRLTGCVSGCLARFRAGRAGHTIGLGGRQLRVLLILLALDAGRVVPSGSLAEQIWPGELPADPGNALQTLVSRLRAGLRRAGLDDVIESHPAGYRLVVPSAGPWTGCRWPSSWRPSGCGR